MPKPPVNIQGRAIVEYDYTERYYYLMLPDGDVWVGKTRSEIEKYAKRWAKKSADKYAINTLIIEWRDCPTRRH